MKLKALPQGANIGGRSSELPEEVTDDLARYACQLIFLISKLGLFFSTRPSREWHHKQSYLPAQKLSQTLVELSMTRQNLV